MVEVNERVGEERRGEGGKGGEEGEGRREATVGPHFLVTPAVTFLPRPLFLSLPVDVCSVVLVSQQERAGVSYWI